MVHTQIISSAEDMVKAYEIRDVVFVLEQKVPREMEQDELDATAIHVLARLQENRENGKNAENGKPVGTGRLVIKNARVGKIGRVAVLREARGQNVGAAIMQALADVARQRGLAELTLDSQVHAIPFYEKLGYVAEGPAFDDCGIMHRHMRCALKA
jgi:predicted GNAT family N-acyltransferase